MFKGIEFFKGKSRGAECGLLRFARNDICSVGRSMIEMLGVLAIVGVLSVGGIAGYSKAMEKFKVNKLVEEYTSLMFGLMEHMDNFSPLRAEGEYQERYYLAETIQELNLLPAGWKVAGKQGVRDSAGNFAYTFVRSKHLTFDLQLGATDDSSGYTIIQTFSSKLCFELFNNLLKPLHSSLYYAGLWKNKSAGYGYYGDKYCGDSEKKCLNEATLAEIQNIFNVKVVETKQHDCDAQHQRCDIDFFSPFCALNDVFDEKHHRKHRTNPIEV